MARFENRDPSTKSGKRNLGKTNLQMRQDQFDYESKHFDATQGPNLVNDAAMNARTRPGSNKK